MNQKESDSCERDVKHLMDKCFTGEKRQTGDVHQANMSNSKYEEANHCFWVLCQYNKRELLRLPDASKMPA